MPPTPKTALITGASSGIGEALAKALAARGAHIALLARTASALEKVAGEIRANGGAASIYPVDAGDWRALEIITPHILAELGPPDVLINSAGAGRWLFTEETEPEEAISMMNAPYFAAFFTTRAFLPAMLARRSGVIVNINSPVTRIVWPGAAGYAAARGALQTYTNALRADLYGTGLHVLSVVCGEVKTPYFTTNPGTLERAPWIGRKLIPALTAQQVAAATLHALEHRQREIVLPFMLRVFYALHYLAPRFIEWLAIFSGHQHTRKG